MFLCKGSCYQGMEFTAVNFLFQAAQQDKIFKTADAVVLVTIGDENDNPPVLSQASYDVFLLENSPNGMEVLQVTATDPDEVKRLVLWLLQILHF